MLSITQCSSTLNNSNTWDQQTDLTKYCTIIVIVPTQVISTLLTLLLLLLYTYTFVVVSVTLIPVIVTQGSLMFRYSDIPTH